MHQAGSFVESVRPLATPYFQILQKKLKWGERETERAFIPNPVWVVGRATMVVSKRRSYLRHA
jgi:hypothetical protein